MFSVLAVPYQEKGRGDMSSFSSFLSSWLQFFFLMTPFFVLSMFLSMTSGWNEQERFRLSVKITVAAFFTTMILFFFGNGIFHSLGITVDAFRIGGGTLLFLSAVNLVNGIGDTQAVDRKYADIAVVPLAIPVTVGPGTTGALLVIGAGTDGFESKLLTCLALFAAVLSLGAILVCASRIERFLSKQGIVILSKLTGLVLAALSAQMIFTGIRAFLH